MARPEWRDPAKERFWRRMLGMWRRSGLTGRGFCAEHELSEPSFYAWRRELAVRDRERGLAHAAGVRRRQAAGAKGPTAVAPTAVAPTAVAQGRARPAFVKVAVMAQTGAMGAVPPIELILSAGRLLRVPPGFDPDLLRQLLRVLEEPAC
jgi:hypothetical protein